MIANLILQEELELSENVFGNLVVGAAMRQFNQSISRPLFEKILGHVAYLACQKFSS